MEETKDTELAHIKDKSESEISIYYSTQEELKDDTLTGNVYGIESPQKCFYLLTLLMGVLRYEDDVPPSSSHVPFDDFGSRWTLGRIFHSLGM